MRVFIVPEAATLLNKGGAMINLEKLSRGQQVNFQVKLLKLQMELEDVFINLAVNSGQKCLVLCDRGVMDGKSYISESLWQALLDEIGLSQVFLRDRRYDSVVHLVSAANGAADFYDIETNDARYETVEQAKIVDKNIQKAWTGHHAMTIIKNTYKTFEDKILKCISVVCDELGLLAPIKSYRKYLIRNIDTEILPILPHNIFVQILVSHETFLKNDGDKIVRLIKSGQENSFSYSIATHIPDQENQRIRRKQITSREYLAFKVQKDDDRKTVKKVRQCFLYDALYYRLDTFKNVHKGVTLLIVEAEPDSKIDIPPFLELVRDVTNDPGYTTRTLAKKSWYMDEQDLDRKKTV